MKTEQKIAIRQLEEKIHLFSSAVNRTFLATDDFVLSNTHISTDTFNLLLPTSAQIKDPQQMKTTIEHMQSQKRTFSTRAEHRGKGLGNAMFHYLLTQTENKQKCVILQASYHGKHIYQRAGFQPIGEMIVFE
ncbi:GNAT family N-acetyltransferase [Bacillus pumilus]|uniref:GNAT family N-acetyltransferase n=1 Tax=Bacillus pumilus TaxID=1408 RepID=UPI002491E897|nr:GNAT family N-acetyltransferase [Bacillus pumilus]